MKEDKKREREREYKIEKVWRKTESARRKLWIVEEGRHSYEEIKEEGYLRRKMKEDS